MSKIKTSVYIKKSLLQIIDDSARMLNVKTSVLVSALFVAVKNNRRFCVQHNVSVKYQKDDKKSNWKIYRINLESEIYEACIDMRNVFKFSVSYILAYAIMNCLNDVVNDILNKDNENNYTTKYTFMLHHYDDIFGFTVYWGEKPIKITTPQKKDL